MAFYSKNLSIFFVYILFNSIAWGSVPSGPFEPKQPGAVPHAQRGADQLERANDEVDSRAAAAAVVVDLGAPTAAYPRGQLRFYSAETLAPSPRHIQTPAVEALRFVPAAEVSRRPDSPVVSEAASTETSSGGYSFIGISLADAAYAARAAGLSGTAVDLGAGTGAGVEDRDESSDSSSDAGSLDLEVVHVDVPPRRSSRFWNFMLMVGGKLLEASRLPGEYGPTFTAALSEFVAALLKEGEAMEHSNHEAHEAGAPGHHETVSHAPLEHLTEEAYQNISTLTPTQIHQLANSTAMEVTHLPRETNPYIDSAKLGVGILQVLIGGHLFLKRHSEIHPVSWNERLAGLAFILSGGLRIFSDKFAPGFDEEDKIYEGVMGVGSEGLTMLALGLLAVEPGKKIVKQFIGDSNLSKIDRCRQALPEMGEMSAKTLGITGALLVLINTAMNIHDLESAGPALFMYGGAAAGGAVAADILTHGIPKLKGLIQSGWNRCASYFSKTEADAVVDDERGGDVEMTAESAVPAVPAVEGS